MEQAASELSLSMYDLENHLFKVVNPRFHEEHSLGAFDFFLIIIWKANRAKSKVASKLLEKDIKQRRDLEPIVRDLTASVYQAKDAKSRLWALRETWGLRLPMASAVLTVLYPDVFTIYDIRVCQQIPNFKNLDGITDFDRLWKRYSEFLDAVSATAPTNLCLRDKDRFLWVKSFKEDLESDVKNLFRCAQPDQALNLPIFPMPGKIDKQL